MRLLLDAHPLLWSLARPDTIRVRTLRPHHRDPFDRILVAQALEDGLTIVRHDPAFAAYAAPTLWS